MKSLVNLVKNSKKMILRNTLKQFWIKSPIISLKITEKNIINGKEKDNFNNEKQDVEKEDENKFNGQDINNYTVDKLREELKNRKIDFPKTAKKKELMDLLINSNK